MLMTETVPQRPTEQANAAITDIQQHISIPYVSHMGLMSNWPTLPEIKLVSDIRHHKDGSVMFVSPLTSTLTAINYYLPARESHDLAA